MKCDKCSNQADFKITVKANGGLHRDRFACDVDLEAVKAEVSQDIINVEKVLGNPFYPEVSKMRWGPVEVLSI
ncbi:MAG: hypothetical protein ACM3KM_00535 [Acidobacteriaceae bacterium]